MHRSLHVQAFAASSSCHPQNAATATGIIPARRSLTFRHALAPARHAASAAPPSGRRYFVAAALPGQRGSGGSLFNWLQVPFSNPSFAPAAVQQQQRQQLWRQRQRHGLQRSPMEPHIDQDELDAVPCDSTAAALVHSVVVLLLQRLLLPKEATADKDAIAACEDALILIVDGLESGIGGIPPEQLVPELLQCGVLPALARLVCDDPLPPCAPVPLSPWPHAPQQAPMPLDQSFGTTPVLTQHPSWQSLVGSWALPAATDLPTTPALPLPDNMSPESNAESDTDPQAAASEPTDRAAVGVGGVVSEEQLALRSLAIETLYSLLALHILPQVGRYPEAVEQLNDDVVPRVLGALNQYVTWLEGGPACPFSTSADALVAKSGADSALLLQQHRGGPATEVWSVGQPVLPDELLRMLQRRAGDSARAPAWLPAEKVSGKEDEEQVASEGHAEGKGSPTAAARLVASGQQKRRLHQQAGAEAREVLGQQGGDAQQQEEDEERRRRMQLWSDVGTASLSCALRLCSAPEGAAALVSSGAVPLLCRLLHLQPTRHIAQVSAAALHAAGAHGFADCSGGSGAAT